MNGRSVALVGPGNIGTDLMMKLVQAEEIDVRWMVGVDPASDGLRRARELGIEASAEGVEWLLEQPEQPSLVIEATSAAVHSHHAPLYRDAGIRAIDLTPAAVGPFVVPTVNLREHLSAPNLNMITCGGQATIPVVAAVGAVTPVLYAEIVASIASRSAGVGTRQNIDEFTRTTARAIEIVGGAARGKAIIILNPASPPVIMRDTIYCMVHPDADQDAVADSVLRMVDDVAGYVPGYRLKVEPQFDPPSPIWGEHMRVTVVLEVAGAGDYLPPYAGNLDIMTAAAAQVARSVLTSPVEISR